jgi:hypothetical protein
LTNAEEGRRIVDKILVQPKDWRRSELWQRAQSGDSWIVVMDLSRQTRRKTSSSTATMLKEWN